jgi:NADP-dependent 3-hydroxy acid dehydrogenase YdfG
VVGIANGVARCLQSHGSQLSLAGRNQAKIESLAQELDAPFMIMDGTDFAQVEQAVTTASNTLGDSRLELPT